jgi:hypothetical protein
MLKSFNVSHLLLAGILCTVAYEGTARGALIGRAIHIEAVSGDVSGAIDVAFPPSPSDPYTWSTLAPIEIRSNDNPADVLAWIDGLSVTYVEDPQVQLNFAVTAGTSATTFTISSATLNFPTIVNPQAFATAALTLTDGDSDGALLTGLFPGSTAYEARYGAATPTAVFADLVSPITAPADDSATGLQRLPMSGRVPILGSVGSIESQFRFVLSANDSASGTSRFDVIPEIIPEPSTVVLLATGLAGMLLVRWRMRRTG